MGELTVIGTLTLAEPDTFRVSYPTACWYTMVEVPAGEYPVFGVVEANGEVKDTWVVWHLEGTITDEHFPSGFGGHYYANPNDGKNVGKPGIYHGQTYAHAVAKTLVTGGPSRITLNEEFEARRVPFIYNGEQKETFGIFRVVS